MEKLSLQLGGLADFIDFFTKINVCDHHVMLVVLFQMKE